MKYVVFGSGGFAKQVISYIESDGHEISAVVSTEKFNCDSYNEKYHLRNSISAGEYSDSIFILAVADIEIKKIIVKKNEGITWGNFVHSSCNVSTHSKMGKGIVICPYSSVVADAKIENFVSLNLYCTVGHDTTLGNYVTLSPYCGVMGYCDIGDECFFGAASYCIPKVRLGPKIKVSAGSIVRHSYDNECALLGNPARPRQPGKPIIKT